jgi:hypothetical protein
MAGYGGSCVYNTEIGNRNVMWMDWDSCVQMVVNNETPNCIWMQELEMVYNTITKTVSSIKSTAAKA